MNETKSLGEAIPEQRARVRELLVFAHEIGPAGTFAAMVYESALRHADKAVISGDPVEMIRAFQELKDCR